MHRDEAATTREVKTAKTLRDAAEDIIDMSSLSKKQILLIAAGAVLVIGFIALFYINIRRPGQSQGVTLSFWGTDPPKVYEKILDAYKAYRPSVTIKYAQIDSQNYRDTVLQALAAGGGPDIFYIGNHELPKLRGVLAPLDPAQYNPAVLPSLFPEAAGEDLVSGGKVYAFPLYMDTLALIYNRGMLDQASIAFPPKTWDEFLGDVSRLRKVGSNGQITAAAAAIGGSEDTVDSGTDLLELLMLQNGAQMTNQDLTAAAFAGGGIGGNPGLAAFNFYLQFANAASPYYTWNDQQPNSLESFAGGNTAMIFNYASSLAEIKSKSPYLDYAVAPMPQPTGASAAVNYPRYFGLAVSRQSKFASWAWDFVLGLTTTPSAAQLYINASGRPPALRALIEQYMNDPLTGSFAKSALTARSWHEADDEKTRAAFNEAIKSVLNGQADPSLALKRAQDEVSQLMSR